MRKARQGEAALRNPPYFILWRWLWHKICWKSMWSHYGLTLGRLGFSYTNRAALVRVKVRSQLFTFGPLLKKPNFCLNSKNKFCVNGSDVFFIHFWLNRPQFICKEQGSNQTVKHNLHNTPSSVWIIFTGCLTWEKQVTCWKLVWTNTGNLNNDSTVLERWDYYYNGLPDCKIKHHLTALYYFQVISWKPPRKI